MGLPVAQTLGSLIQRSIGALHPGQDEVARRSDRARYHLGRGRRARERGELERAAREARLALVHQPGDPWAHALLGQSLARQQPRDLLGARESLERACALSPRNGYFVGLLLEVLAALGDAVARDDALARAWWAGAPVDRWLAPTTFAPRGRPAPPNLGFGGASVADRLPQPVGA